MSGLICVNDIEGKFVMLGDLFVVEIFNFGFFFGDEWGFIGIFDCENGGGFFIDYFLNVCKVIWDFEGIWVFFCYILGIYFIVNCNYIFLWVWFVFKMKSCLKLIFLVDCRCVFFWFYLFWFYWYCFI